MGEVSLIKIGVVGSRDFGDLSRVSRFVEQMFKLYPNLMIVSGGAKGVDRTAVNKAKELGVPYKEFLPDPKVKPFVKAAHERNTQIVEYSDWVYAFFSMTPDSRGTVDSMRKAIVARKLVAIYTPLDAFQSSRVEGPA